MSPQPCRKRHLIVLTAIAWSCSAGAALAQAPDQQPTPSSSLAIVRVRVPIGDLVSVTDSTGATIKGALAAVTDEAVQVRVRTDLRSVAAAHVRRIQWQQPDSPLTGVLIGAAIGAIPGIYWLAADPNECTGMCPEEYAFIAIGAVIGGIVDRAIHKTVTVYVAEGSRNRTGSVTIGPLVMRDRKGVRVAVTF